MKHNHNIAVQKTNPELNNLAVMPQLNKLDNNDRIMDISEFIKFGYLQELNRLFLHPLGLSLVIDVFEDGIEKLSFVMDYRDEGIDFDEELMKTSEFQQRIKNIQLEFEKKK